MRSYTFSDWVHGKIPVDNLTRSGNISASTIPAFLNQMGVMADSDYQRIHQAKEWAYEQALELTVQFVYLEYKRQIKQAKDPAAYAEKLIKNISKEVEKHPAIELNLMQGIRRFDGIEGDEYKRISKAAQEERPHGFQFFDVLPSGDKVINNHFRHEVNLEVLKLLSQFNDGRNTRQTTITRPFTIAGKLQTPDSITEIVMNMVEKKSCKHPAAVIEAFMTVGFYYQDLSLKDRLNEVGKYYSDEIYTYLSEVSNSTLYKWSDIAIGENKISVKRHLSEKTG